MTITRVCMMCTDDYLEHS